MNESEQAQTVAENKIRKILYRYRGHIEEEDMDEMIEIVDSQAQRITELQAECNRLDKYIDLVSRVGRL